MTDKELLELAAKAAGIKGEWQDWEGMEVRYGFPFSIYSEETNHWNPLYDDGAALRLAVKLDFNVEFQSHMQRAVVLYEKSRGIKWICEDAPKKPYDRFAPTRRAIVRAAAEIGRVM